MYKYYAENFYNDKIISKAVLRIETQTNPTMNRKQMEKVFDFYITNREGYDDLEYTELLTIKTINDLYFNKEINIVQIKDD